MRFFDFLKIRTLRVNILTIFLLLLGLSSLTIMTFTYSKNSDSIYEFSEELSEQVSRVIIERITEIIKKSEDLADITISLLPESNSFSFDNKELISYMLSVAKTESNLYGIYFGVPNGSLLEVVNLAAAYQNHFIFDSTKPLPKESAFVLRVLDRSKDPVMDDWSYKDRSLKTIAFESLQNPLSDPRTRLWYQGAVASKKIFWTPVYNYDPLGEPGITVSKAIFTPTGELIAAVGVDISLNLFSHFLTDQKIGKNGKAFILNTSGEIIIPEISKNVFNNFISKNTVDRAFSDYAKNKKQNFILESDKVRYLASAHTFPVTGSVNWIILIVAPMNDFLGDIIQTQHEVVLISLAVLILSGFLVAYFSKKISVPIVTLANETNKIRHLDFESEQRVHSNILEISLMDKSVAALRVAMKSFGRYIPKQIVLQLLERGKDITIGGEKKEVTIFFSDIAGFSTISETYETEKLMPHLSEYFDALSKIILKNQGNIDKYIGDSIMALWGAPLEVPNQDEAACKAALECQDCLTELNDRYKQEGKPLLLTRIGIDSGEVIVGNIGTEERMNYTTIGNSVNVASRLQAANKNYQTKILISEKVAQKIKSKFLTRALDIVELKGKKEKTKIFELMAEKGTASQVELSQKFTEAFEAVQQDNLAKAKALFLALQEKFPEDKPTLIYLERLK